MFVAAQKVLTWTDCPSASAITLRRHGGSKCVDMKSLVGTENHHRLENIFLPTELLVETPGVVLLPSQLVLTSDIRPCFKIFLRVF